MERFCDELRWEREQRQVSIEAISDETKVSMRHLLALEAGNYSELPRGVFRRGIVRSYLAALGLEESTWIEKFESSLRESGAEDQEVEGWAEFAENVRRNRGKKESETGLRWMGVAMMAAALLALSWCVWRFVLHGRLI
jgi:cytoskeleton protein RodZ